MTRRLTALAAAGALTLVMAVPALAGPPGGHPPIPDQALNPRPDAAAAGMHVAFSKVGPFAQHILCAKSPHPCPD